MPSRTAQLIKRAIDIGVASVGLAVTAPLFPVVALAVKLTSPGPVFFRQRRCGAERRVGIGIGEPPAKIARDRRSWPDFHTFEMLKFRTMRADAEARSGPVLAKRNDPRLTPIGGFLRKTRLDELPQLIHVLQGEMSIVGPRPERPEVLVKLAQSIPYFEERMRLVKPGLTGLAQINLGYDGSIDEKLPGGTELSRVLRPLQIHDGAVPADGAHASGVPSNGVPSNGSPSNGSLEDTRTFANKLLFDLAYCAILEDPWQSLRTDLTVIVRTPLVMLRGLGR